ncbi:MAG TPA: chemotaxis protein CheW [Thermoanaerobaculia bacterium]|nr:chemotaxis protein CheW [Thermoanaerobaculia bacterium]
MVDLVKIRKKKNKEGTPASSPPPPVTEPPVEAPVALPPATSGGEDAAASAGEMPALPATNKLERFKEQAGKRRETQSIQQEQTQQNLLELLTFVIAGEQYAVDIERIVEIVTPRSVTRIPNADASVVGIMSLRGTIVTLVDVRGKLRHPTAGATTADTRIVVIDFHNEIIGFVVDRVLRVVKTASTGIEPHPVVHAAELDESIRGVFRAGGALTILLDLDKLLDHRALSARSA